MLLGHSYGGSLPQLPPPSFRSCPCSSSTSLRWAGRSPRPIESRWESLIEAGERELVLREFLGEVGGYREPEIEAMESTPAWELRKQVLHTVPRELRAELGHVLDEQALGGVRRRC